MRGTEFLSKKRLLELINRLPGTIFEYREWPDDSRRIFPYSTCAIEDLFFATPKELAKDGDLAWSRISSESAIHFRKILDYSALRLEEFQTTIQTVSPEDELHWVNIHAVPERQHDGSTLWCGRMEDITARYEGEDVARQNAVFLKVIFENLKDHFYFKNTEGCLLKANPACYRHHGFSCEEDILGKTDMDLYPGERGEIAFEKELDIMQYGKTIRQREEHPRSDGSIAYLEATKSPMRDHNGNVIGLIGISRDITQQVQYEKRLMLAKQEAEHNASIIRAIFNNLEDHFYYKDRQSRVLGGNKPWAEFHGASSIDELLGKTDADLYPAPLGQHLYENEQQQMKTGEVTRLRERYPGPNGTFEYIEAVKSPIKNSQGEVIGLVGISRNITKQIENEEKLITAQMEAEAANRSKSAFLAMMSHEIRTPMNGVIGAASLLMNSELTDQQEEFVQTIQVSGENLLTIINDILDYSKIEAGKIDLESVPFSLRECVENVFDLFIQTASKKNIELLCNIEPNVPEYLCGDPTRLRQIVINLLGNAVKFTDKGEVSVKVSLLVHDEENQNCKLEFSVRDTGIGISKEAQSRLFQSFTQADASSTRKYGGTGLGLAISRRLAILMGGDIHLESEEKQGSVFSFSAKFPLASLPENEMDAFDTVQLKGKRVLVADDNGKNRAILDAQLKQWGAAPELFSHPDMVIDHLKEFPPYDIMLIDFHMPLIDGVTLAKYIYDLPDYPVVPIIILSSSFETVPNHPAISARMAKPVKMHKLQQLMLKLLSGPQQQEQPVTPASSHTSSKNKLLPLRVLVAEDNAINQRVIKMMLDRLGCEDVVVVKDGQQAVDTVSNTDYDVVLMDVQMPNMNGLDATREIRKHSGKSDKPWIIALTAGVMEEERKKVMGSGMNDFLAKPLSVDQLEQKLQDVSAAING